MTNQELYKQAILDAKAVRETALAAAKQSLSEAFEPRIMEMMRLKLSEELEEDKTEMEESYGEVEESTDGMPEEGAQVDENTLEEILAELDELSTEMEENAELEEGATAYGDKGGEGTGGTKKSSGEFTGFKKVGGKNLNEADDEEADDDTEEAPEGGEAEGDDMPVGGGDDEPITDDSEVIELTVGELKAIFRDAMATGGVGAEMGAPEMGTDGEGDMVNMGGTPGEEMEEISLEEILAELENDSKMEENLNKMGSPKQPGGYSAGSTVEEAKKQMQMKKDLEEANKAVKAMKNELNEINLLNAKLLYFNKILKAKSLNESQKVKVMNAFDRAVSVKEVENTYKTLNESITAAPKKTALKESMGFASKPIGSAPARPIVEADAFVMRWQTLAGIK